MKERLIADFHIHSHYSMATSQDLVPEQLELWARRKGINLIGSGDITHPGWLAELQEKLEPAESGIYKLKKEYQSKLKTGLPEHKVRFILTGEISSIYKDKGKTRKIHNLFIVPDLETAGKFQKQLEAKGINIRSDGRPICGVSAHDLFEIGLETDERIFCIPAHIWTPWFSLFGAKSGYNRIEDCFGDLSERITTLETGLSADVPMIRLVSALDKYSLISSSDAHSPSKLGRNATLLEAGLNWQEIIDALRGGRTSTLDMYPQAGKYHYDGHRKCGVCWHPLETAEQEGICPVCGRQVTIGVLNRVYQLADRTTLPADTLVNWQFIMPLPQIISRITGVGENSKTVQKRYLKALEAGRNEFEILLGQFDELEEHFADREILEFLRRFRSKELEIQPGYDGEYGSISLKRNKG